MTLRRGETVGPLPSAPADTRFVTLCVTSVVASAALMFIAEPMVARQILPHFGGSPAVWNTAMVCYQALLLAGYAYAHWSVQRLGLRRQMLLQAAMLLAPLLLLPPWPRAGPDAPATAWPGARVALSVLTAIGLPMFVLASNASLVQRWWAGSTASGGRDPYRLYAASNAGSLIALLAYPVVIEPLLGTRAQSRWWAMGYVVFVLVTALVMGLARRTPSLPTADGRMPADGTPAAAAPISRGRRLRWLVLAAVPASLLLSTTLTITTDLTAVPLLWVIPLASYLATFIVAFAAPERLPRRWIAAGTVASIIAALGMLLAQGLSRPPWLPAVLAALAPLLFGALLCHLDLARDRPHPTRLTEFYLWLALGGVLGGALNSLVAPLVFNSVAEYPLTLAVLAWLVPAGGPAAVWSGLRAAFVRQRGLELGLILCVVALAVLGLAPGGKRQVMWLLALLATLPFSLFVARPPLAHFAVAATLVALVAVSAVTQPEPVVAQARSFFGVLQVRRSAFGRVLMHGTTVHGAQADDPTLRRMPSTYYHPHGPLGSAVAALPDGARLGVVGLGTGALASLTRPGQTLDYYEIDPLVETLARRYFTYLADAPGQVDVRLGDGRLLLAAVPDGSYDLLVIDAFSSDAVPAHLLTSEALDLYCRKVKPDGLVLLHVSNRHLDLRRVVLGWAQAGGHRVAHQNWQPLGMDIPQGAANTIAVALAPANATIQRLVDGSGGRWQATSLGDRAVHWTDDFTNLLSVWGGF